MIDTEQKIEAYVEIFEDAKRRVGNDEAAIAIVEQIGKDTRTAQIWAERNGNGDGNTLAASSNGELATSKQIGYLKRLGVDVPKGMTKEDASQKIDELTGR